MTGPTSTPVPAAPPVPVPAPSGARPAPRPAVLRRRARAAVARSAARDRWVVVLIGLLLLTAGTLTVLLSYGVFGRGRAARPLLDPVVVDVLRAEALVARSAAIAVGVLLVVLGLVWAARSVRPERRPDVVLDGGPDTRIVVSSAAAAEAVAQQAGRLPGVGRARARLVGTDAAPALRITLWLTEDAHVGDVLDRLDEEVLGTARSALDIAVLPAAVRLELDAVASPPRVA